MSKVLFTGGKVAFGFWVLITKEIRVFFEVKEIMNSWPYKNVNCGRQFGGAVV